MRASRPFARRRNTFGGRWGLSVIVAVVLFSAAWPAEGQVNWWTKPTSGSWEEPYWSLGLPSSSQTVEFTNAGWKALAIGADTTAHYPASLTVNDLIIDAPTNSFNQLLLNWAGLNVPLNVHSNLTIGTNGSLASHYSALHATNACIDGVASFSDSATEDFGLLWLRPGATLSLTDGTMTSSNLVFDKAIFTQSGGTHVVQKINPSEFFTNGVYAPPGFYHLHGGALVSHELSLNNMPTVNRRSGFFWQSGGVHTNSAMTLGGWSWTNESAYLLEGGLLTSSSVELVYPGLFTQNGGTNLIQKLNVPVAFGYHFNLHAGQLVTSNTTILPNPDPYQYQYQGLAFLQDGGTHIVQGRLSVDHAVSPWASAYDLTSGTLLAPNIEIGGGIIGVSSNGNLVTTNLQIDGGQLSVSDQGSVSNSGILLLGGTIVVSNATKAPNLGQLQVSSGGMLVMHYPYSSAQHVSATVVRFSDSRALAWSGGFSIKQWGLVPGDHIFFGTNAEALTAAQLAHIEFVGTNANYPAKLLPTGELVPVSTTNEWTKATSGYWEEAYWSLGRLPGMDQGFVVFDNPGWKSLAIGPDTAAQYPASLSVNNLVIDAPVDSFNQLILNWAGMNVPLSVNLDLRIGTNGSLASHCSALRVVNADIAGSASFSDNSAEQFDQLTLRSGGTLNLTNGVMTCSNLTLFNGTFSFWIRFVPPF